MLKRVSLSEEGRRTVLKLLREITKEARNLEEGRFVSRAALFGHELPSELREVFYEFKLREAWEALLITNNPVQAEDIGPTPAGHWRAGEARPLNLPQVMHGLYASLLGEIFGFKTQQNGRIFNDLITIPGYAGNSSSGAGRVGLHTEDASETQPYMPDYLGFLCLRNERHAVTTFSSLRNMSIPDDIVSILFEQPVLYKTGALRPMLFGHRDCPYLRYSAIEYEKCGPEIVKAARFVADKLTEHQQGVTLGQGDCLYLDNCVAVHGRAPFEAEYGANGRWFSRLFMLRDLRQIRSFTNSPESRIFGGR